MGQKKSLNVERLNWADVLFVALMVPKAIGEALAEGTTILQVGLLATSRDIDAKRKFARQASKDIEAITGGGANG